jgi:hypothetical protein
VNLLAEHSGVALQKARSELSRVEGLINYLNRLATSSHYRLRQHPMDTSFDESVWLQVLKPENLVIDPARPLFVRNLDQQSPLELTQFATRSSNTNNSLFDPNPQRTQSRRVEAPPATFITSARLGLFIKELVNLHTIENVSPLQVPGHLQWSLVLIATLFATLLWWWLQQTG